MMQPCVDGAGINEMGHAHLLNAAKPLKNGMTDQFQNQGMADGDEAIYRIIDDFLRTRTHDAFDFVKRRQIPPQI
jgi:hypothetical protein